jgi:hypothetical protein
VVSAVPTEKPRASAVVVRLGRDHHALRVPAYPFRRGAMSFRATVPDSQRPNLDRRCGRAGAGRIAVPITVSTGWGARGWGVSAVEPSGAIAARGFGLRGLATMTRSTRCGGCRCRWWLAGMRSWRRCAPSRASRGSD